jgi:beta-lactamase regulating signal transducer with metallopeptidase domain/HEAT repeat protein
MSAFIDTTLTSFVLFMADWSVRWIAIAILPILWLKLRPPQAARLRYQLCLATIVVGLALPLLPRWGGILTPPQTPLLTPTEAIELPEPARAEQQQTLAAQPAKRAPVVEPAVMESSLPEAGKADADPIAEPVDWPLQGKRGLVVALSAAWLMGAGFMLARLLAGSWFLYRLRATAQPIDAVAADLLLACRTELHLRRHVRLAIHHEVTSPLLLGPWDATVLVPEGWSKLPLSLQRASLLHELAHLRRRDDWAALVLQVANLGWFFHPCFRWLLTRLECERELCCDDLALASGVEPGDYARMLRDLASNSGRFRPTLAIPFGKLSTIKLRIHHILEGTVVNTRPVSTITWIAASALVVTCLVMASMNLTAAGGLIPQENEGPTEFPVYSANQPLEPAVPKNVLLFGGKSFKQWQNTWRTDLKPEVRIEAFQALSTFGKNGYMKEAGPAIIDLASSYDPTTSDPLDKKVYLAAIDEIVRLGPPVAPALEAELKHVNVNVRRFCAIALNALRKDAKPAEKGLLAALNDSDSLVRHQAALSLEKFAPSSDSKRLNLLAELVETSSPVHRALYERVDKAGAYGAIEVLRWKGRDARSIVPRLVKMLGKETDALDQRILQAIIAIGGEPKEMAQAYAYSLEHPTDPRSWRKSLQAIQDYGLAAKPAAPALLARYRKVGDLGQRSQYLETLISIGADPKDLVPLIQDWLNDKGVSGAVFVTGKSRVEIQAKFEAYLKKHIPESAKSSAGKSSTTLDPRIWSVPGTLGRTTLTDSSGKKVYRLTPDNLQTNAIIYCEAEPRIELEPHVNRHVRLYGEWGYHKNLRQNYMKVSEVSDNFD